MENFIFCAVIEQGKFPSSDDSEIKFPQELFLKKAVPDIVCDGRRTYVASYNHFTRDGK